MRLLLALSLFVAMANGWSVVAGNTRTCYFGLEPDPSQSGLLRWVLSASHTERCSCNRTILSGFSPMAMPRPRTAFYTDVPIISQNQTEIRSYFHCQDVSTTVPSTIPPPVDGRAENTTVSDVQNTTDQAVIPNDLWEAVSTEAAEHTVVEGNTTNYPEYSADSTNVTGVNGTTPPTERCSRYLCGDRGECFMSVANEAICSCYTDNMGPNCQLTLGNCNYDMCQNDGSCVNSDVDGYFLCHCEPGFRGPLCDKEVEPDCQSLSAAGYHMSGMYIIYPNQTLNPNGMEVYCDFWPSDNPINATGWIVLQWRTDWSHPSVSVHRNWSDYRDGFVSPHQHYWLGNEKVRQLTSDGDWELLVEMETGHGVEAWASFLSFRVEGSDYRVCYDSFELSDDVTKGDGCSPANDPHCSCEYNNENILQCTCHDGWRGTLCDIDESTVLPKLPFSTYDNDNDNNNNKNCAEQVESGWWLDQCFTADLPMHSAIYGEFLANDHIALSEMKLRKM